MRYKFLQVAAGSQALPSVAEMAAALDWMDANQLGRRNLTPEQMSILRGRIYNRSKKTQGTNNQHVQAKSESGQNVHFQESKPTHETLGDRFGVSGKTVQRDGKFVSDIESLEQYSPGIGQRVMAGEVKRKDVAVLNPNKPQQARHHSRRHTFKALRPHGLCQRPCSHCLLNRAGF